MSPVDRQLEPRTLYESFQRTVREHTQKTAFLRKHGGRWQEITWSEHRDVVAAAARSLAALGVEKGDPVSILSATRLEWVQIDTAIINIGATSVGIYHSNLAPDCEYILNHAESEVLFVEDDLQLDKVLSVRQNLPHLKSIVSFEGATVSEAGVLSWADFLELGRDVPDATLERMAGEIEPDDVAAIVYTSGTTGVPKGAMITHRNLLFTAGAAQAVLSVEPHYVTLLFLPLAHVYARVIASLCQFGAITVAFAEEITKVPANLKEIRPQFIISVPRIYEKICERVHTEVESAGGLKKKLFDWAIGVGREASRKRLAHEALPLWLSLRHSIADRLVLRKIRDVLGGRLVWGASGAAPLNVSIAEFFHAVGIQVVEGLGMTENTSLSNANTLAHTKLGTVGPAVPGVEMKLAEDGEVLFRGANVMKGYYKNPEATAETIDEDGWLKTGDIGEIDEDGFLKITDRKKDLIITAGGKNIAPQRIEKIIRTSPFISQVVAYGDRRKYITALIALDPANIKDWARKNGIDEQDPERLSTDPRVHALVESEIQERNRQLASFESVKKFRILAHDLTIEGGELTPTLKIKRKVVLDRHRELLESMYAPE